MVRRRSYRRKRYGRRRRKVYRRNRRFIRRKRVTTSTVHNFVRSVKLESFGCSPTVDVTRQYYFTMSQVPLINEFNQLYDEYFLRGVKIQLVPRFTEIGSSSTLGTPWHSAIDLDDANSVTQLQMMEYPSYKRGRPNQICSRYIKPNYAVQTFGTTTTTGYTRKRGWLDMNNQDVQHYGFKFIQEATPLGSGQVYDVYCKYYFSCRGIR